MKRYPPTHPALIPWYVERKRVRMAIAMTHGYKILDGEVHVRQWRRADRRELWYRLDLVQGEVVRLKKELRG